CVAALCSGCSIVGDLYIERTWPEDQDALLIITDESDTPLEAAPRLFRAGEDVAFALRRSRALRLYVRAYAPEERQALATCPPLFRAGGRKLPPAASAWRSQLISPETLGAVSFEPDPEPERIALGSNCPIDCFQFTGSDVELPSKRNSRWGVKL